MSKGTPALGKHNKTLHIRCRRCGRHSYHKIKSRCAACGYPGAKIKKENWKTHTLSRKKRRK